MPIRPLLLTVALCTIGTLAFSPAYVPPSSPRTISGTIIDAGTATPLSDVRIVARGTQLGSVSSANGTFSIADIPAGASEIDFRHPCYFRVTVTVPDSSDAQIEIGLPFDRSSTARAGCGGLGARKQN